MIFLCVSAAWAIRQSDPELPFRAGRFEESLAEIQTRRKAFPYESSLGVLRGKLLLYKNHLAEARKVLIALPPTTETSALLAEISYRKGNYSDAAIRFEASGRAAKATQMKLFAGVKPYRLRAPNR